MQSWGTLALDLQHKNVLGPQDREQLTFASSQSYLLSAWLPHPNPPGMGILACLWDRFSHQYCPLPKFSLFTRNMKNAEHWLFSRPSAAVVRSLSLHSAVGRRVVCLQAIKYYRCSWAHKQSLLWLCLDHACSQLWGLATQKMSLRFTWIAYADVHTDLVTN